MGDVIDTDVLPVVEAWDDVEVLAQLAERIADAAAAAAFLHARGLRVDDRAEARLLAGLIFGEISLAEDTRVGRALEQLIAMLDDRDDVMALYGAITGIGYLFRAPEAAPALRGLVDHDSMPVRQALAGALRSAHDPGDAESEVALIRLSTDSHQTVRTMAARALVGLSGPPSDRVLAALTARTGDESAVVATIALFGLVRAGVDVDRQSLAAVLRAEVLDTLPAETMMSALEAAALSADERLFATLQELRSSWAPPDPVAARVLIAALAWCAPPGWVDPGDGRPPFDERLARWLTGKRCLIGLRTLDRDGDTIDMTQIHGEILRFTPDRLLIRDLPSGEQRDMPPDTSAFRYAPRGAYRLRSSGQIVADPDAECRWSTSTTGDGEPV
jgi:hypothetical protein